MKLFTAIYDDARLLTHFLRHYGSRGITEFFIAVSPPFFSTVKQLVDDYRITLIEGLDVADSILGGTAAVTEMRKQHQGNDEWVVIVDLDEFVEFLPDIHHLITAAECQHANVVRGVVYDRFSKEGTLVDVEQTSDLSKICPVKARFITNVMVGCPHKGVLVKGKLHPAGGHHLFVGENVFSETLEIAHYKWITGAIDRLKSRYTVLSEKGIGWAIEYKRTIDHYEERGRFAWEEFGGELTNSNGTPLYG